MKKSSTKRMFILNETNSENIEQVIVILKDNIKSNSKLIVAEAEAIVGEYERKYFGDTDLNINYEYYEKNSHIGVLMWMIGGGILSLAAIIGFCIWLI